MEHPLKPLRIDFKSRLQKGYRLRNIFLERRLSAGRYLKIDFRVRGGDLTDFGKRVRVNAFC